MKKLLSLLLALALMLSLGLAGMAASGESAAETEEEAPWAAIVLTDEGEAPEQERAVLNGYTLDYYKGGTKFENSLSGFLFQSEDPTVGLFYSELTADKGEFYTLGGAGKNITPADSGKAFTDTAVEWMETRGVDSYDSAILLGDSGDEASCEPVINAKGWTYLNIQGVLGYIEGYYRSAVYSDVSGGTTIPGAGGGGKSGSESPVVVIRDSLLETTGSSVGEDGTRARGIQPQGKSVTYLYDSAIVSRTWGAYSTDSARGALELISHNSMGLSLSGYGAYADTSCHLFLYGSTVMGGSDGIVASNNGEIYAVSSDSGKDIVALREQMGQTGSAALSPDDYDKSDEVLDTVIAGGSCAVQFHMPDQQHSGAKNTKTGILYMEGGKLETLDELVQDELSAYTARYSGACIVTKSTQADILLDGTEMRSRNGVLVHCMVNSDSNVNNIADGDEAPGSDFTFRNMDVAGDIVHDDYQRALRLTLDGTTLTGAVYSNTVDDWNAFCEAELEGEYILDPAGYETFWGVELTLDNGAVWNVTETSVLAALNVVNGTVNGTVTENADGTVTVEPLAESGDGESFELNLSVGGTSVSGTKIGGSVKDGEYRFELGDLLAALGLTVSYDEADGTMSFNKK